MNMLGRSSLFVLRSKEFPDGEFLIRVRARLFAEGSVAADESVLATGRISRHRQKSLAFQSLRTPGFRSSSFVHPKKFPRQNRAGSIKGLLVWITNAYDDGKPPLKPVQRSR